MTERPRLTHNAMVEEFPQYHRICHKTKSISQQYLGSKSPPKEAEIGWVSRKCIHPVCHQDMIRTLGPLDNVVEIGIGLLHGSAPHDLADNDEDNTGPDT